MKKILLSFFATAICLSVFAQGGKLNWGGYGEITYNQKLVEYTRKNGELDVQRLVLLADYKFTEKTKMVTEIEFEHVKELYVEQAYLQHDIKPWLKLRAGLMLIPMGIINEYHESSTFNGVERPTVDNKVVPTTWREIGAGCTGRVDEASLAYQLYVVNGLKSYDGGGKMSGSSSIRGGRQKGAESIISYPNLTARVEYYGIASLKVGTSGYFGKTQSTLYDDLADADGLGEKQADSSVVSMAYVGVDARYKIKGFEARAQYIYGSLGNTDQYNALTDEDLGSAVAGGYLELGYNVLNTSEYKTQLIPFVRYSSYNTHADVAEGTAENGAYDRTDWTFGLGYKLAKGAMLKADYQVFQNEDDDSDDYSQFNMGVGLWF